MANAHGAIARIGLLHHKHGKRLANYPAPSDHDAMLPFGFYIIISDELKRSGGSCGQKAWKACKHATDINWMESVDVLPIVYGLNNFGFGDMLRKWQLNDEAIDIAVVVQAADTFEELFLANIVLKSYKLGTETYLAACSDFGCDVRLACAVVPNQYGCKAWSFASVSNQLLYVGCYLRLDVSGHGLSVDDVVHTIFF
jgi:hypothetical protein